MPENNVYFYVVERLNSLKSFRLSIFLNYIQIVKDDDDFPKYNFTQVHWLMQDMATLGLMDYKITRIFDTLFAYCLVVS